MLIVQYCLGFLVANNRVHFGYFKVKLRIKTIRQLIKSMGVKKSQAQL